MITGSSYRYSSLFEVCWSLKETFLIIATWTLLNLLNFSVNRFSHIFPLYLGYLMKVHYYYHWKKNRWGRLSFQFLHASTPLQALDLKNTFSNLCSISFLLHLVMIGSFLFFHIDLTTSSLEFYLLLLPLLD